MSTNPSPKLQLLRPEDLEQTLHRLALAMPLATSDQPFGPEHTVYRVGGKMFAMYTEGIGYPIVNLKTDPEESEVLQHIYPSVIPAWHMNKRHWISVGAGEGMTEQVLEGLVEDAYLRVMYSLPKSKRPIEFRERPVPEKH
ncbi:MmcQ/YjbR family DNA-binding protein [Rothia mucilaginosa]